MSLPRLLCEKRLKFLIFITISNNIPNRILKTKPEKI